MAKIRVMNVGKRNFTFSAGGKATATLKPKGMKEIDEAEAKKLLKMFPRELKDLEKSFEENQDEDEKKSKKSDKKAPIKEPEEEVEEVEADSEDEGHTGFKQQAPKSPGRPPKGKDD